MIRQLKKVTHKIYKLYVQFIYYFIVFQIYPCFRLTSPDVLIPLQVPFSSDDIHIISLSRNMRIFLENDTYNGVKMSKEINQKYG